MSRRNVEVVLYLVAVLVAVTAVAVVTEFVAGWAPDWMRFCFVAACTVVVVTLSLRARRR